MPTISRKVFGRTPDGTPIDVVTLKNDAGAEIRAMTYGGIILSIRVPDRYGHPADVTLGYDGLAEYLADNSPYFGTLTGRVANRIAGARFTLDGRVHRLAANDGVNHLHGGPGGFDRMVWRAETTGGHREAGVELSHTSPDGHEGYPGDLAVRVSYTLTEASELIVDYRATSDRPTPFNPTQHTYFNLACTADDVRGHWLTIPADTYLPVREGLIPTGEIVPVDGTPFDFRSRTLIGAALDRDHPQLRLGGGFDHTFLLRSAGGAPAVAALVEEPATGRVLEVRTTEPAVHLYTANFFDGRIRGKQGRAYRRHQGLCLETQHYPDAPNQPHFPSIILRPGAEFRSRTIFRFGVSDREA